MNQNHMMYDSWDMKHKRIFFSHFGPFFALLNLPPPLKNPKNQNFEKIRKSPRDIIILHKCTINENHMIYGSPDINCNRQIFFVILCHFWPFYPLTAQKIKKMPGDIIILHKCTKNHDHMLYCSWDMACDGCNCYFSLWAIFWPFTPLTPGKMKISKIWKKCLGISSLYMCITNYDDDVWFLRYGARQRGGKTDGQTDGQKKWHIETGDPPKNYNNKTK